MKKKFTFLMAAVMLLMMMSLPGKAVGQDRSAVATYQFTTKSWTAELGNWTSGQDGSGFTGGQGVQISTTASGANATSPVSFNNISQIVVRYCTNSAKGAGTIKVKVGNGTEKSYTVTKPSSGGTSLKNATFTYNTVESGAVKIQLIAPKIVFTSIQ